MGVNLLSIYNVVGEAYRSAIDCGYSSTDDRPLSKEPIIRLLPLFVWLSIAMRIQIIQFMDY
jgi:hypothetical protein